MNKKIKDSIKWSSRMKWRFLANSYSLGTHSREASLETSRFMSWWSKQKCFYLEETNQELENKVRRSTEPCVAQTLLVTVFFASTKCFKQWSKPIPTLTNWCKRWTTPTLPPADSIRIHRAVYSSMTDLVSVKGKNQKKRLISSPYQIR